MRLIELDELQQFAQLLHRLGYSREDFELAEWDTTDPKSDELTPMKGYVQIRHVSSSTMREYPTGDGADWLVQFEKDLEAGHFA
jgi:hypothetical protein